MQDIEESFRKFQTWCRGKSRLYEEFCSAVIHEPDLQKIARRIPEKRARPYVMMAAVHHLLLENPGEPLAEFYPDLADDHRAPGEDDPKPLFIDFCNRNRDEIVRLASERGIQTNEIRRCAALLPGFAEISRQIDEPFSIIEIGPSAGLNMFWDQYRYEFGDHGSAGTEESDITISSEVREGNPLLPGKMPEVKERLGIDLNPLDVEDEDDSQWLKALTWPEHTERRERLEKALGIARQNPPEIIEGDAVEKLAGAIDRVEGPVVVYGTQVLWKMSPGEIEAVLQVIEEKSGEKEIYWLFGERGGIEWLLGDREVEGGGPDVWMEFSDGSSEDFERLGRYEIHGKWLKWEN